MHLSYSVADFDSLSATHLGLPRLIREEDVHCEYPADADDEYVTEKGFLPTLPGEFTKLSSALALFRMTRILSKVLAELYPASSSHDISFRNVASLADELEEWSKNLAPHLKLTFAQDKPSTNVTSSRAPILVRTTSTFHHTVLTRLVFGVPSHPFAHLPPNRDRQPRRQSIFGRRSCW
jgi:hypothetical protein